MASRRSKPRKPSRRLRRTARRRREVRLQLDQLQALVHRGQGDRQARGQLQKSSGIELARRDVTKSRVNVEVSMASVSIEPPKLQGHLKSPDFFDVEKPEGQLHLDQDRRR
ncbi:MAG: YceI family protein [Polyangiaceae bacterium]